MSLIKCKECKKEISDGAEMCPNCGIYDPTNNDIKGSLGSITLIILSIVMSVTCVIVGMLRSS